MIIRACPYCLGSGMYAESEVDDTSETPLKAGKRVEWWTYCKDKLPRKHYFVWAIDENDYINIGFLNYHGNWEFLDEFGDFYEVNDIVAWMPMLKPEPPYLLEDE